MRIKLRTRIERLENRIIPESDGLLPLAVLRHCMDGSLSPSERTRWGPLIARIVAAANVAADEEVVRHSMQTLAVRDTSESPRDQE
jgi:hypothetical protein